MPTLTPHPVPVPPICHGNTSFHLAAQLKSATMLTSELDAFLADMKLNPEQLEEQDASGLLPLHWAAQGMSYKDGTKLPADGHLVCVQEMLRLYPNAAMHFAPGKGPPLQLAMESSAPLVVLEAFLRQVPDAAVHLTFEDDWKGACPMSVPLRGLQGDDRAKLLQLLAEPERDPPTRLTMHLEVALGMYSAEELRARIKEMPGNAIATDDQGRLPLHWAIACGAPVEVVEVLLEVTPSHVLKGLHHSKWRLMETALRVQASLPVVQTLQRAGHEWEAYSLGLACKHAAPVDVVEALACAFPHAGWSPVLNHVCFPFQLLPDETKRALLENIKQQGPPWPEGHWCHGRDLLHVLLLLLSGTDDDEVADVLAELQARTEPVGEEELYLALVSGCAPLAVVQALLQANPSAAATKRSWWDDGLALHVALRHGPAVDMQIVQLLVQAHPEAVHQEWRRELPLWTAIRLNAPLPVVELLVVAHPAAVLELIVMWHTDRYTKQSLSSDIQTLLLQRLAQSSPEEVWMREHWTAGLGLHLAVALHGSAELVQSLLTSRPESLPVTSWEAVLHPLHLAVTVGSSAKTVDILLKAWPESAAEECITLSNSQGLPLHTAVTHGALASVGVVEALLLANPGAAAVCNSCDELPLHVAAAHGAPLDVIELLLRANREAAVDGKVLHELKGGASLAVVELLMRATPEPAKHLKAFFRRSCFAMDLEVLKLVIRELGGLDPVELLAPRRGLEAPVYEMARYGSPELLEWVLDQYPQAASVPAYWQTLPLRAALSAHRSHRVLYALIRAYPEAVMAEFDVNEANNSPQHYALPRAAMDKATRERLLDSFERALEADGSADPPRLLLHAAVALAPSRQAIDALQRAAPIEAFLEKDEKGRVPLHIAVSTDAGLHVVEALLQARPEAARVRCASNKLPLHYAMESKLSQRMPVVKALLAACPEAATHDHTGELPYQDDLLYCAVANGASDAVGPLLQAQLPVAQDSMSSLQQKGHTLRLALKNHMHSSAEELVRAYPEAAAEPDDSGALPLDLVSDNAPIDLIKTLLWAHCKAAVVHEWSEEEECWNVRQVLERFSSNTRANLLQSLMREHDSTGDDTGSSIWDKEHWTRGLALHLAMAFGASADEVRVISNGHSGACLIKDWHGRLPLHWAALYAAPLEVVDVVLQAHPAAASIADKLGMLPLHWAVRQLAAEAAEALLWTHPEGALQHDENTGAVPMHGCTSASMFRTLFAAKPEAAMLADLGMQFPLQCIPHDVREELLQELLDTDPDVLWAIRHWTRGLALHLAVGILTDKHLNVLSKLLLERPESAYAVDGDGRLPLHWVATNKRIGQRSLYDLWCASRPTDGLCPHCAKDNHGLWPVDIAAVAGFNNFARYWFVDHTPRRGFFFSFAATQAILEQDLWRHNFAGEQVRSSGFLEDTSIWEWIDHCEEEQPVMETHIPRMIAKHVPSLLYMWAQLEPSANPDPDRDAVGTSLEEPVQIRLTTQDSSSDLQSAAEDREDWEYQEDEEEYPDYSHSTAEMCKLEGKFIVASVKQVPSILDWKPPRHLFTGQQAAGGFDLGFVARQELRVKIDQALAFLGRYTLEAGRKLEHRSATCVVVFASDRLQTDRSQRQVALKLMQGESQFTRELVTRQQQRLNPEHVIGVLRAHAERQGVRQDMQGSGLVEMHESINLDGYGGVAEGYHYCLVMERGDRNLNAALMHERFAGVDWDQVRVISRSIAQSLGHMHDRGLCHLDVKPLNCMRHAERWKLIDLDVSCPEGHAFGGEDTGKVKAPSSGYAPPEMAKLLLSSARDGNLAHLCSYRASRAYDLWSYGCLLFHMATGQTLWHTDQDDNVQEEVLEQVAELVIDPGPLHRRLKLVSRCRDGALVRTLLEKLLEPRPDERVAHFAAGGMSAVLSEPFFNQAAAAEGGAVNQAILTLHIDMQRRFDSQDRRLDDMGAKLDKSLEMLSAQNKMLREVRVCTDGCLALSRVSRHCIVLAASNRRFLDTIFRPMPCQRVTLVLGLYLCYRARHPLAVRSATSLRFEMCPCLLQVILGVEKVPSLVVFVPHHEKERRGWMASLRRPGSLVGTLLNKRVDLHFVCALTCKVSHTAFPLTLTKDWVAQAAPYLKVGAQSLHDDNDLRLSSKGFLQAINSSYVTHDTDPVAACLFARLQAGLTILKLAAAAGRLSGFPVPDVGGMLSGALSSMTDVLEELRSDAEEVIGAESVSTLSKLYSSIRQRAGDSMTSTAERVLASAGQADPSVDRARSVVTKSADALAQILDVEHKGWETRTGLQQVRGKICTISILLMIVPVYADFGD